MGAVEDAAAVPCRPRATGTWSPRLRISPLQPRHAARARPRPARRRPARRARPGCATMPDLADGHRRRAARLARPPTRRASAASMKRLLRFEHGRPARPRRCSTGSSSAAGSRAGPGQPHRQRHRRRRLRPARPAAVGRSAALVAGDPSLTARVRRRARRDRGTRTAGTALAAGAGRLPRRPRPPRQRRVRAGHAGLGDGPGPVLRRHRSASSRPRRPRSRRGRDARLAADADAALAEALRLVRRPLRPIVRRTVAAARARGSIGRERAKDILVLENLGARRVLHELVATGRRRGAGRPTSRLAFCVTIDELPAFVGRPGRLRRRDRRAGRRGSATSNERVPPPWFDGPHPRPGHLAAASRRPTGTPPPRAPRSRASP